MTIVNLPTCIDCDRVVRAAGYCRTCSLGIDLARRSAEAAAATAKMVASEAKTREEATALHSLGVLLTPLEAAGLRGDELRRARDVLAQARRDPILCRLLDEAELARLLYRPSEP